LINQKSVYIGFLAAVFCVTAPVAMSNPVLKQADKLRAEGMTLWRDGDFLGAFGACFGAKKVLDGSKEKGAISFIESLGYAELCIGLALQQMKVRGGKHDHCRAFKASQKHFARVDEDRRKRGLELVAGSYLAEQLKDSRCK
jgi:hypothetical protein